MSARWRRAHRSAAGMVTTLALVLLAACGRPDPVPPMTDPAEADPPLPAIEQPGPEGLPPQGDTLRRPTERPAPRPTDTISPPPPPPAPPPR
jgi:hypothetical protein